MSNQTHSDKTSADTKIIGFDFQYYFFLYKLLGLRKGESVGFEILDDVHTTLNCSHQIFYQVKHTIDTDASGRPKNLTTSDTDLWKTLYNWSMMISDPSAKRASKGQQLKFLSRSTFVLFSNKSSNSKNKLIKNLSEFIDGLIPFHKIKNYIVQFSKNTSSSTVQEYVKTILKLEEQVLSKFLLSIQFELDENDIILKCKEAIQSKMVPSAYIDSVFRDIDSKLREEGFNTIRNRRKFEVQFDDFYKHYAAYFISSRDGSFKPVDVSLKFSSKLENQTFIRQLIDIKDCKSTDTERIARYSKFKLKLINSLMEWQNEGFITNKEVEQYHQEALLMWDNKFNSLYNIKGGTVSDEKIALEILGFLRVQRLNLGGQMLDLDISNGEFYHLSDQPSIGWSKDWEKYKS